jgi:hypothetical protein
MSVHLKYEHVQKAGEQFGKAGLDASAFTGCTDKEIGLSLPFQQEILSKSYNDYCLLLDYCSTNYIFAMEYKKRKDKFAAYAADNAGVTPDVPLNFATVMIYKNAMKFELDELLTYFYVFLATDEDRARRTPGRITPDLEECLGRYYSGYSGCLSVVCVAFAAIGCLLTWA